LIFFPEEFVFIISYDMTLETGQGSRSSERLGGYELFIFSLFYTFQNLYVSVVPACCFVCCHEYVSYILIYCFISFLLSVFVIRYMPCLHVSMVQLRCFTCCCSSVSVVLICCFTCSPVLIHVPFIYDHVLYMLHMFLVYMFIAVMNMIDIMISFINHFLYVIIIMLIYGIKITQKLPNILTTI
jgi:hypothetical protein